MKRSFALLLAVALTGLLAWVTGCERASTSSTGGVKYHCPMHPTYVSDRPGDCPICNMKLVPIAGDGATARGAAATNASGAPGVPGRVVISISPEKQQRIGLRTAKVEKRDLQRVLRATAVFEHDESRYARVAPRFGGWVRKLDINFTGQEVVRGAPLLTVYSPELLAAETEYLLAWKRGEGTTPRVEETSPGPARSLYDAARRRLSLLGVDEEEVRALEQRGTASDEAVIRSPVSGHVLAKTAVEGRAFMAGETLYEIADLSRLWLRAAIYEHELPLVRTGQVARIFLPGATTPPMESQVEFIYPHIDPVSRRGFVRLSLENHHHQARPEMWADVEIAVSAAKVLAAPASAILDTGVRSVAFVLRDDGHLEPREVQIGLRTDDYSEIRGGLADGEAVVTRALFLVDSESQLKAAIAGMSGGQEGSTEGHAH